MGEGEIFVTSLPTLPFIKPSPVPFLLKTMVNNINNFGVINFYENNHSEQKKEQAKVPEDITPVEPEPEDKPKSPKDIWGIPQKGKYNQVREYIKDRKKGDPEFKEYCMSHSLREICAYLTEEFGWDVDEHSLGANLNRNRYS